MAERARPRRAPAAIAAALLAPLALAAAAAGPAPDPGDGWADVTRFGAVGDGVQDDTDAFARAAATGKGLLVPRPPRHYRLTSKVRVRGSVVGQGMPEIRMYGAAGRETHAMFELQGYDGPGAVFRGLHLDGQWDGVSTAGEWSHLILVKGSRNVTIEDNLLQRPYGDCVLVGGEGDPRPSEDVLIRRNRMEGPRRCDVAVISARRLSIRENQLRKGNAYVAAIDLEPNPNDVDAVHDVEISRNDFDVKGVAILLYTLPSNLPSGGVTVRDNTARADRFLVKARGTGRWSRIAVSGNTLRGGGDVRSLVDLADAAEVTIGLNTVAP